MHDHIVHFYHLHALDWVDVVSALSADPKATSQLAQSISAWPLSSPGYFKDLQGRLKKFVESGQLGPFKNGYWGHPAYKLPPEANLMAVAHYLEALDFQKEMVKIHTIYGGKNPHPNWLVGGVPCAINIDQNGAVGAVNMERLNLVSDIIDRMVVFTEQVYLPDLQAIASFYKDWLYGGGLSSQNVLAYGDVPEHANDYSSASLKLPRGAILNPVEIRDVRIPQTLEDAMSQEAQAERERRARVILGAAEVQVSDQFAQASRVYAENPGALHLRAMNMLYEAIKERGSMVIVPSSAVETMGLGGTLATAAIAKQQG